MWRRLQILGISQCAKTIQMALIEQRGKRREVTQLAEYGINSIETREASDTLMKALQQFQKKSSFAIDAAGFVINPSTVCTGYITLDAQLNDPDVARCVNIQAGLQLKCENTTVLTDFVRQSEAGNKYVVRWWGIAQESVKLTQAALVACHLPVKYMGLTLDVLVGMIQQYILKNPKFPSEYFLIYMDEDHTVLTSVRHQQWEQIFRYPYMIEPDNFSNLLQWVQNIISKLTQSFPAYYLLVGHIPWQTAFKKELEIYCGISVQLLPPWYSFFTNLPEECKNFEGNERFLMAVGAAYQAAAWL